MLMIDPNEAAKLVDWPNPERHKEIHEFVLNAGARDVQTFIHAIRTDTTDAKEWKSRGGIAIGIRISDDQMKAMEELKSHTATLVDLVQILKGEAKILRWLNIVLIVFTACLIALTIRLVVAP